MAPGTGIGIGFVFTIFARLGGLRPQGRKKAELRKKGLWSIIQQWTPAQENIENFHSLAKRVLPQMDVAANGKQNVLFAHGGVVRLLYGLYLNLSLSEISSYHIDNCVPIVVDSPANGWTSRLKDIG